MKVLIYIQWPVKAWSIPDAHAAAIAESFPDVEFVRARTIEDAAALIGDVDACFTPFLTREMVVAAPRLKWVHSPAAAVEGLLPLAELDAAGVIVTNSKGIQAIPIAEHVMGGILLLSRRFDRMLDAQRERRWIQNELTEEWPWMLHGQRMTVVGLGTIGVEIARRAHAFGMQVTGVRRRPAEEKPAFVHDVVGPEQLDDALRGRDVVVLSAPGIASTNRMIGAPQLALLNRSALLVNVARAAVVDEEAMRAALAKGQLGGAVLDVFEREPLDPGHPLWTTPNVVITPHSSGFRRSHWDAVSALYSENLRRYRQNESLDNVVNLAAGY